MVRLLLEEAEGAFRAVNSNVLGNVKLVKSVQDASGLLRMARRILDLDHVRIRQRIDLKVLLEAMHRPRRLRPFSAPRGDPTAPKMARGCIEAAFFNNLFQQIIALQQ